MKRTSVTAQRKKLPFLVLIALIGVTVIVMGIVAATKILRFLRQKTSTHSTACILDARICPDGSAVGRNAPNCEFAPCPPNTAQTKEWQTYENARYGYSIKYPGGWRVVSLSSYGVHEPANVESTGIVLYDYQSQIGQIAISSVDTLPKDEESTPLRTEDINGIKYTVTDTTLGEIQTKTYYRERSTVGYIAFEFQPITMDTVDIFNTMLESIQSR